MTTPEPTEAPEKEPLWVRIWGEFTGLVGLVGDLLVELGTAMQDWSSRRLVAEIRRYERSTPGWYCGNVGCSTVGPHEHESGIANRPGKVAR